MTTQVFNMVQYAFYHCPYYRKAFGNAGISEMDEGKMCNITELPVLTKNDVFEAGKEMMSSKYDRYPDNQYLDIRRTSGSTGKMLKIYWDRRDNARSLFSLWKARKSWYGITPDMKFCSFYTINYQVNKVVEPVKELVGMNGRNISFNKADLGTRRLLEIYTRISEFNPKWLTLQPSIARLLAELIEEQKLPLFQKLSYIELGSEMLTLKNKEYINKIFGIRPSDMYGTNELNCIAITCAYGNMHIMEENVYVEILKDGQPVHGEEGEIYITSLTNHAMPFIRYETGDTGIIIESECPCGHHSKLLKLTSGRVSDYVRFANGDKMSSFTLAGIMEYTNENMGNAIKQFQIRQHSFDDFEVILALKEAYGNWGQSIADSFLSNLKEPRLDGVRWKFTFVNEIFPDTVTGKHKYFIHDF